MKISAKKQFLKHLMGIAGQGEVYCVKFGRQIAPRGGGIILGVLKLREGRVMDDGQGERRRREYDRLWDAFNGMIPENAQLPALRERERQEHEAQRSARRKQATPKKGG